MKALFRFLIAQWPLRATSGHSLLPETEEHARYLLSAPLLIIPIFEISFNAATALWKLV